MTRKPILDKNGKKTQYFWSEEHGEPTRRTVFKDAPDGIKKMRGVYYDVAANKMQKA